MSLQGVVLLKIVAPVSPSTPFSSPPLMNQTIPSAFPSVVVAIGPVVTLDIAAHHAIDGVGGLPGSSRTATTARPLTLPGHILAPLVVEKTK